MSPIGKNGLIIEHERPASAADIEREREVLDNLKVRTEPDGTNSRCVPGKRGKVHPVAAGDADGEFLPGQDHRSRSARAIERLGGVHQGARGPPGSIDDVHSGVDYQGVGFSGRQFQDAADIAGRHDVVAPEDDDPLGT